MRSAMKHLAALALLLCLLVPAAVSGEGETGLEKFRVSHGSRDSKKIAITMDDVWEPEYVWKTMELCKQYGIRMTFFPCGCNIKEEDADSWRALVDEGFEIGCHSMWHDGFCDTGSSVLYRRLVTFQEHLENVLGYHYATRWFRPPFGTITDKDGRTNAAHHALTTFGYEHILLWDVSQTDPDKAILAVRNGSILLYHAREKDYECLVQLVPQLLEAGFEPVTVSALFGYDLPETSAFEEEAQ